MLVRFILFTVLAYFIFRWLDRLIRPSRNERPVNSNQKSKKQNKSSNVDQGKIKSVIKDDVGDYVDFEEIDEKK